MKRRAILALYPVIALAACQKDKPSPAASAASQAKTELLPVGESADLGEMKLAVTEVKSGTDEHGPWIAVHAKFTNRWRHKAALSEVHWTLYDAKDNALQPRRRDQPGGPDPRYPAAEKVPPNTFTDGWLVYGVEKGAKPVEIVYRNTRGDFASWKLS
ncbi:MULTISPECIES: hypothetical protein [unclassified Luteococcus]|uniref:hypothetical protein n=1 Tax=unclassified Luteococcus TaxID=2639923 RepID=UPI00313C981B